MKRVLFVAAIALVGTAFGSCKKCYQCKTTVTYDDIGIGTPATATQEFEFCGSKKEMKAKESEGTGKATTELGGITLTQTMDTNCD